jgi:hypothetical protein
MLDLYLMLHDDNEFIQIQEVMKRRLEVGMELKMINVTRKAAKKIWCFRSILSYRTYFSRKQF